MTTRGSKRLTKKKPVRTRASWVGAPEIFGLEHALMIVAEAFGETCYLVGSAVERRDFRDVDVRMIVSDEKWLALFGNSAGQWSPFWSLLCTSVAEYLARRSGLKVDFQIQRRSGVKPTDWEKIREPLAIYPTNTRPAWRDL